MNKSAAEFKDEASFTVYSHLKWPSSTYTLFLEPFAPAMNLMFYGGWKGRGDHENFHHQRGGSLKCYILMGGSGECSGVATKILRTPPGDK